METRAHFALIGAFTVAVVAAAFSFVLWFSGGAKPSGQKTYRLVFTSSVAGLGQGSTVLFDGLRVGEVTSLKLGDDPNQVYARIKVDQRTPIKTDTRARLDYQGLTGVASVALLGGGASSPPLIGKNGKPPTLYAERSDYQNIVENLQSLSGKADSVLDKANRLLGDNAGAINETVRNLQVFTKALAANASGLKDFMGGMADLGRTIKPLAGRLQVLSDDVDSLVKAVDPKKVKDIVGNTDAFTADLAKNKDNIDSLLASAAKTAGELDTSTKKLDAVLANAKAITQAVDPKKLSATVDDVAAFADTLKKNRATTDQIMKNAEQLTAKLNKSADKIDAVLASAQGFLGSPGSKGMFQQVAAAAKSIQVLANNLDRRTKKMSEGINKFTGPGLRNYEALATDGRRTLAEINRAVRSLKRNPQQVIFGAKPSVPEYGGR
ncbi:MAG TPA: MlaD family protein [Beijerinckiaceae bacterium]|nr:MlaD family protein [Beijerinckiaceae bacterium]